MISYQTKIYVGNKFLECRPTQPFQIGGQTYKNVIVVSSTPTDFIVVQNFETIPFHSIKISANEYVVNLPNSTTLPADVKAIIGTANNFMSTTNFVTTYFLTNTKSTPAQSTVDLSADFMTNYITTIGGRYWTVSGNIVSFLAGGTTFSFDQLIGSPAVEPCQCQLNLSATATAGSYFVPFSAVTDIDVSQMNTNSSLIYNPFAGALSAISVITNKLGSGQAPGPANIAYGNNTLAGNMTGQKLIAIGNDAMSFGNCEDNNIAVGHNSLKNNTGQRNIAVGNRTLENNTSGRDNIAIGHQVLFKNTNNSNIGIGYNTLYNNVDGSDNIGIGFASLNSNTVGFGNVGVGSNTLNNNDNGNFNVSVGYEAGSSIRNGNDNICIGRSANYNNLTGNKNISIGSSSLEFNLSSDNIGIGNKALSGVETGSNNLAIGVSAGSSYQDEESNNILLANNGIAGDMNTIRIGSAGHRAAFIAPNILRRATIINLPAGTTTLSANDLISPTGNFLLCPFAGTIIETPVGSDLNNLLGNVSDGDMFEFIIRTGPAGDAVLVTNSSAGSINVPFPIFIPNNSMRTVVAIFAAGNWMIF